MGKIILISEKYVSRQFNKSCKTKKGLEAWTEVSHQIFGGWEVYQIY